MQERSNVLCSLCYDDLYNVECRCPSGLGQWFSLIICDMYTEIDQAWLYTDVVDSV